MGRGGGQLDPRGLSASETKPSSRSTWQFSVLPFWALAKSVEEKDSLLPVSW